MKNYTNRNTQEHLVSKKIDLLTLISMFARLSPTQIGSPKGSCRLRRTALQSRASLFAQQSFTQTSARLNGYPTPNPSQGRGAMCRRKSGSKSGQALTKNDITNINPPTPLPGGTPCIVN